MPKRIRVVNRDFQFRIVRLATLAGIVTTSLTCSAIFIPMIHFEIVRSWNFLPDPIFAAIFVALLLNIVTISLLTVFVTHKIAGPMYALHRAIRVMQASKIPADIRIRADDEFQFIIRNFNEISDALRQNSAHLSEVYGRLHEKVHGLALDDKFKAELLDDLEKMKSLYFEESS